jgi:hypothetical protein
VELRVVCPVCGLVEQAIRSAIKNSYVASSWHFISTKRRKFEYNEANLMFAYTIHGLLLILLNKYYRVVSCKAYNAVVL